MKLHHIGFVVSDIDAYVANLPPMSLVRRLHDPVQNAELVLLDNGSGVYVEVISPKNENSFTYNFLKQKGGGYHHLCYLVHTLESALELIRQKRMTKTLGPVYAPLLEGDVVFAYSRNREVVEFLICPRD